MFASHTAAISVLEVIETYLTASNCSQVHIKWINDVFLGDKKICGILPKCET